MRIPAKVIVEASCAAGRFAAPLFAGRVRNPVFIVGCGRSGTTLLNHLFDQHPEVANFPSEANELWHPRLYPWHESKVDAPPFFIDPVGFTRTSLALRTAADDRRLLGTFGAFQTVSRRPVFLNKTVMVTFMLDKVVELFPSARFVHLYRDGRAVALSALKKERDKLTRPRYVQQGHVFDDDGFLRLYVAHWQEHILALDEADRRLGLRRDGRLYELGYEELCRDPRAALTGLARFLGVSAQPFVAGDLGKIENTNYKARGALSGDALVRMSDAGARGLSMKGYGAEIR